MALLTVDFRSNALARFVGFKMLLPNDAPAEAVAANPFFQRPTKTLFLLHGFTGFESDWLMDSHIRALANTYNLAVVFPRDDNSFYLDGPESGRAYATFVGEELPGYVAKTFGLSAKREDVFIGGFSMGGFGALHTALAYPERFAAVISFSAALIHYEVASMEPGSGNPVANYDYYRLMFGEPKKLLSGPNSPDWLVEQILEKGGTLPRIFQCVGTEDFLYEPNQQFRSFLTSKNIPFEYRERPGVHDFVFVNAMLEEAIRFLLEL